MFRALGKQNIGAAVNLVAYYVVALPFGIWCVQIACEFPFFPAKVLTPTLNRVRQSRLAFNTSLGLKGLWIGQCVALTSVGIGQYIVVCFCDWEKEVDLALDRGDEDCAARGGESSVVLA